MSCSSWVPAAPTLHQRLNTRCTSLLSNYFANFPPEKSGFPRESFIANRTANPAICNTKIEIVPSLKIRNVALHRLKNSCSKEPRESDSSSNLIIFSSTRPFVESRFNPAVLNISGVTTDKTVGRFLLPHGRSFLTSTSLYQILTLPPKMVTSITFNHPDFVQKRFKMTKVQAYRRSARASPCHQSVKAHIGVKRLSAEYVQRNQLLVKQRKNIAFNPAVTRLRHFKIYPGENVKVLKNTSLAATCDGRVKFSFNPFTKIKFVNILPEKREELLPEDLWRYRTEHTRSMEENRHLCFLRTKATPVFPKPLVNPPTKPPPRPRFLGRWDEWENPSLPDSRYFYK
ncbi:hypothetical protein IE077_004369 [Cardiosporidium cionae]|uniref:Uncharacterized protein n=1 Tax=Cardiosporidium cionae TaxID=476202 RepID=A0ABQ7JFU0_9APIC|nr:hypothetical protein IE077_004369 [Cardiosporidium cionae]|eukprot:KAF8822864.1 hypothetical protein IE077_004369 [Cardiosporidium cionae]